MIIIIIAMSSKVLRHMYVSALRGIAYTGMNTRGSHEVVRGIAYQNKALKEIIESFPAYKDQLEDFVCLESFHKKYPVGKMETTDELGQTWKDVEDPPPIPAFGKESINMLIDNLLVPILNGSKRWSFETAAKEGKPLLLIPFIADAWPSVNAKYQEETQAPGPSRAGPAATAEFDIDELATTSGNAAGPPLPGEMKTLEYYFERKKDRLLSE